MRDIKRIDEILSLLEIYWKQHPDLRLCQICVNLSNLADPFYIEDDFIKKQLLEGISKKNAE